MWFRFSSVNITTPHIFLFYYAASMHMFARNEYASMMHIIDADSVGEAYVRTKKDASMMHMRLSPQHIYNSDSYAGCIVTHMFSGLIKT